MTLVGTLLLGALITCTLLDVICAWVTTSPGTATAAAVPLRSRIRQLMSFRRAQLPGLMRSSTGASADPSVRARLQRIRTLRITLVVAYLGVTMGREMWRTVDFVLWQ